MISQYHTVIKFFTKCNNLALAPMNIFDACENSTAHMVMRNHSVFTFNRELVMSGNLSAISPRNAVFSTTDEYADNKKKTANMYNQFIWYRMRKIIKSAYIYY